MEQRDITEVETAAGEATWERVQALAPVRDAIIALHRATVPQEPLPSPAELRALASTFKDAVDAYRDTVDAALCVKSAA